MGIDYCSIGARIKYYRTQRELSQEDLAGKSSFTIYPENWIGSIGDNYYESTGRKMRERFGGNGKIEEGIDYGWTVGLKLPTQADIDAEIHSLMVM